MNFISPPRWRCRHTWYGLWRSNGHSHLCGSSGFGNRPRSQPVFNGSDSVQLISKRGIGLGKRENSELERCHLYSNQTEWKASSTICIHLQCLWTVTALCRPSLVSRRKNTICRKMNHFAPRCPEKGSKPKKTGLIPTTTGTRWRYQPEEQDVTNPDQQHESKTPWPPYSYHIGGTARQ